MRNNHHLMLARSAIKNFLKNTPDTAPIGIGCSGGADSLALLAGLSTIYRNRRSQQVHVVIIDHQLQSVTAEVAQTTADYAKAYGFIPHIVQVNVATTKEGVEAAARTARYDAFETIIKQENLQKFFLAHTMNDQAEQVLLGLLRGSGTRSLSGIRETRDTYARPFLNSLTRSDTEAVCFEANLDYWNDPHNQSEEYARVVARQFLTEMSGKLKQDFVRPLAKSAQISSEDSEALDFYVLKEYSHFEASHSWSVADIEALPKSVRVKLYKLKLSEMGSHTDSLTFLLLNRVDEFVTDWRGQKEVNFSNGVAVARKNNEIIFQKS